MIEISIGNHRSIVGDLFVPPEAKGVVIFAHGSGSSRFSSRNLLVAETLQKASLATLLMDLLTEEEEKEREPVFDIELLASRLFKAADWVSNSPSISTLPVGLFGASTGGAAVMVAAAISPHRFQAVVSRGGRPDLASTFLVQVKCPTLLIVGQRDELVLTLNKKAYKQLKCPKELSVVPGATHLFEERGALEQVAQLAMKWFETHLISTERRSLHV